MPYVPYLLSKHLSHRLGLAQDPVLGFIGTRHLLAAHTCTIM